MITLVTGVPGSSKTLNTINEVLNNDTYQNRPVYYYNIPEVKLEWHQLDEAGAKEWFNLPEGSVVVLDECQRLFRPMKYGDKVPAHIEELETHRHLGIDLFVITQHPKLIDTKVRRLVGRHLHFKRQFGMESATKIEFQQVADDPDDYFAQKESIKTRVKFPKKLYGVYKSSEEHTHKRKIPKKLYFLGVAAVLTVGLIYQAVTSFGSDDAVASPVPQGDTVTESASESSVPVSSRGTVTKEQWLENRVPRVPDVPSSAPVYDGVTEIASAPRPQCIIRERTGDCNCYTQQASPLDISDATCKKYATQGYFDPSRPDPARSDERGASGGKSGASADAANPDEATSIARVRRALEIRRDIDNSYL